MSPLSFLRFSVLFSVLISMGSTVTLMQIPTDPLGNLTLHPAGVDLLSSIAGPVALISISGPYRTGKSFLLNELSKRAVAANLSVVRIGAAGDRDGPITFPVGDAVWPVTQGLQIEILGKFGDTTICIVDTPGLFAPIHDYKWDSRVVSFSLLSSSLLLYNSFRTIDQSAVSTLARVGDLAELYAGVSTGGVLNRTRSMKDCLSAKQGSLDILKEKKASTPASSLFVPSLLWVIRDSELAIVDTSGAPISPQSWLYTVLNEIDATSSTAGESSDALRVCTMFSQISAFALPSPFYYIASPSGGSITRSPSLHPDFQVGVDGLLRQLSGTPAKIVSGEELTGPRMAALMRAWVSSINTASRFPKASGDALLALLNAEAVTVASSSYESELSSLLRSLPLSSLALSDALASVQAAALDKFKASAFGNETVVKSILQQLEVTTFRAGRNRVTRLNERKVTDILQPLKSEASALFKSELKKEIDTYPAEESSITKAYGATVRNVQERLASFTNQFGIEFVKPFSDEIYSALDREYKDSIQQNIDASKAACIGEVQRIESSISMSLVSFMTFVREAREGQDQVNAYLSNIHENCKGPSRAEFTRDVEYLRDKLLASVETVLAQRRAHSLWYLNILLLGTVVIGLLFATKCCYRARRRSRWLKRLVFTLCILLCGCLTFFEWRTAGVGTEWVAGIMAMPYKVYDFAMESFVLTVVVMALFGFVSLLSWAQSCRSRR